jgi:hypothetical protein
MKRAILNDVLSPRLDKPLYHYTNQKGLLGIIRSREMWVTHTQYLNDRREFVHAVDLVREEIRRLLDTSPKDSSRTESLIRMEGTLRWTPESINVCVCSFSEDQDSLSQWRAYGAGTSGFAIGFPADLLTAATAAKEWYLAPCVYEPLQQRDIIRSLVEEVLEENLSGATGNETNMDEDVRNVHLQLGGNLLTYLNRYAPILKDESFHAEKEWRVISRPLFNSSRSFDFREGRSLLIPYSKFPLSSEDLKFRLHRIVIGPTPDEARSRSAVVSFLMHEGLLGGSKVEVPVEISKVPYRAW